MNLSLSHGITTIKGLFNIEQNSPPQRDVTAAGCMNRKLLSAAFQT